MRPHYLKYLALAFTALSLGACAQATDEADSSPDAEFGLETLDAKDDSFAIREGSQEAEAVLAYVNQPIVNNVDGSAFEVELDSKLDARAARGIARFRAGDDGQFGTADDPRFQTLLDIDEIPWVGRVALMQLFTLADAAGYFNQGAIECSDYLEPADRTETYYAFRDLASLLEIQNSKCTIIRGDVVIDLASTNRLPPSERILRHFENITTIEGDLTLAGRNVIDGAVFSNLQSVTGSISVWARSNTRVEFPILTEASTISIRGDGQVSFDSLESIRSLFMESVYLSGFPALKTASSVTLQDGTSATVDFPELTTVDTLSFKGGRGTTNISTFLGGFERLSQARSLHLEMANMEFFNFPALTEVKSMLTARSCFEPLKAMTALETADWIVLEDNTYEGELVGPPTLKRVDTLRISEDWPVSGFDGLTYLGTNLEIFTNESVKGFSALEETTALIRVRVLRSDNFNYSNETHVEIFPTLRKSGPIFLEYFKSAGPRSNSSFEKLEEIVGDLTVKEDNLSRNETEGFTAMPTFSSLKTIYGKVTLYQVYGQNDYFPEMEIIDGDLEIKYGTSEVGFAKLAQIAGRLTLANSSAVPGLGALTGVGGDIYHSRSIPDQELDRLLNQLTEFAGNIVSVR